MTAEYARTDRFRGARIHLSDLAGLEIRDCEVSGLKIVDCYGSNVRLGGDFERLVVNDVDVTAYVEAELDRRHPVRVLARDATSPDDYRLAWAAIEALWEATLERASRLPEAELHERVDGEWSFVETQRHLLFASDVWLRRNAVGDCGAWHRLGMPPDVRTGQPDADGVLLGWGIDVCATPSADEVLGVRDEYLRFIRALVEDLSPDQLGRPTACNPPWMPSSSMVPMRMCLEVVIREEWLHHGFAIRDLAVLERRA